MKMTKKSRRYARRNPSILPYNSTMVVTNRLVHLNFQVAAKATRTCTQVIHLVWMDRVGKCCIISALTRVRFLPCLCAGGDRSDGHRLLYHGGGDVWYEERGGAGARERERERGCERDERERVWERDERDEMNLFWLIRVNRENHTYNAIWERCACLHQASNHAVLQSTDDGLVSNSYS